MEGFTSSIEFQMSLLLFVALAGYLVAARINQSAIIGEILVGLIIGPSVFGLITYTEFVSSIAHLGAIILLFVVGLEFKIKDIFNMKFGWIALAGVATPWVCGYFTAVLFGFDFNAAVFTGAALTATSIAITANVLKEMGKLKTDAARAIIGAAVIDDILSLFALSVSTQLVAGTFSISSTFFIILKAAIFIVVGAFVGTKVICRLVQMIDSTKMAKKFPEFVFIFAMMIAFLYALIAEMLSLSAIIGAFLAGVSLGGVIIKHGKNYKEGAEYLHIIFASIFFVSLGIIADLHYVTWAIALFIVVLTIVAMVSKYCACFFASKFQNINNTDSSIIGIGMVPRGEVAMIIALIGLNAGYIKQDIYISLVIMALLTTMAAPYILRHWFFKAPVSQ